MTKEIIKGATFRGREAQGMSTAAINIAQEYHRKHYKIYNIMNPLPMIHFSFKHSRVYSSNTFQTLRDMFYEIFYKITKSPYCLSKLMEANN